MHGGLIALMMRKKVVFLPVAYHKTQAFYDTWLRSRPGSAFASTLDDLKAHLGALRSPQEDLAALFCGHADPALNRFLLDSCA